MTNRVETNFIADQSTAGAPTATTTLAGIRTQLSTLEGSDVITPELFGAVANDPSAAAANFTAIQTWLNSGHLGIQVHDPNNVYYVACYGLAGGSTRYGPMIIRKKFFCPLLRIRPVKVGSDAAYYQLQICCADIFRVGPIGNPQAAVPLAASNAAVTRGQTTFTVTDPGGPTIVAGNELLLQMGKDDYDFDGANGWYRRVKCVSYTHNGITNQGTIVVDLPCPDNFAATAGDNSPEDPARVYVLEPNQADGSWLGYLEIDMQSFDAESGGLAYPFSHYASKGITVDVVNMVNPPKRGTNSTYFGAGSENITLGELVFVQRPNAVPSNDNGVCGQFHNIFSHVDRFTHLVSTPVNSSFREGYAGVFTIGTLDIRYTGPFNSTSASNYYKSNGVAVLFAISKCRPLVINSLKFTTQYDFNPDPLDPSGANDDGVKLSGTTTLAETPLIEHFESNKDVMWFGCAPLYVNTKSVDGPLTYDSRYYSFGAAGPSGLVLDEEVGRIFFSDIYIKQGPDFSGWDFFIYTPPFNDDRSVIDHGTYVTKYKIYGGYSSENLNTPNTWYQYEGPGYIANVGTHTLNITKNGSFDRFFRYSADPNEPAGNYVQIQYSYYPMKSLFTKENG